MTNSHQVSDSVGETVHTLGPWKILPEEGDKPYIRVRGTRLGLRYKIANVISPNYAGALPIEAEETRANARLIAAAPDLLDALKEVLAHTPEPSAGDAKAILQRARAAIAKATGAAQ